MPHFGIESLGHGTGGFLDTIVSQSSLETAAAALQPATVTGTATIQSTLSESFLQAKAILDNILSGGELPETFRENVTTFNLLALGEASKDITDALNEQITIRENQRAIDQEAFTNQQILQTSINEGFTNALGDISKGFSDIGKGGFDPIKFFTDNPLIGGIGIGGLLVGGVVLLVLLK